jgi:hypothetical protein
MTGVIYRRNTSTAVVMKERIRKLYFELLDVPSNNMFEAFYCFKPNLHKKGVVFRHNTLPVKWPSPVERGQVSYVAALLLCVEQRSNQSLQRTRATWQKCMFPVTTLVGVTALLHMLTGGSCSRQLTGSSHPKAAGRRGIAGRQGAVHGAQSTATGPRAEAGAATSGRIAQTQQMQDAGGIVQTIKGKIDRRVKVGEHGWRGVSPYAPCLSPFVC